MRAEGIDSSRLRSSWTTRSRSIGQRRTMTPISSRWFSRLLEACPTTTSDSAMVEIVVRVVGPKGVDGSARSH